ncbi:ATP-binding protein, partial [Staphylococcus devriesei]
MKSDSKIIKYFKTENNILYNKGVIEELTIKIAEEYKIELFEIFPEYKENSVITEALISSLVWRTKNCINTTTKNYINELVIPYKPYREYFLDVMLMKVSQQNHPLNAFHLDKLLKVTTLSIRDYFWTQYISRYNDKAFKIVDWVYDNSHKLNKEVAELYIITLVWLFTTTNKKLRNKSTKSLVKIFSKFPSLVVKTLKLFENNDDAYLVERLYASVYGGVVRSDGRDEYIDIANYIYSVVFEKKVVCPHILLRDYARQTIEYICLSREIINIDLDKIRPPYKSEWYLKTYSNEDIDEFIKNKKEGLRNDLQYSLDKIVNSMTTEHGRGVGGYGDFGRYIFGFAVKRWASQFKNDQELSNLAIMRIFEMGYDANLHGEFDLSVNSFDRHNNNIERISKKYQWIA